MNAELVLYFLDYEQKNLFNYISIGSTQRNIKIIQNSIRIKVKSPYIYTHYDHFTETIKLFEEIDSKDNNEILSFNLDLYIQGINEYYYLINSKNKFSFDIIFFQKNLKKLQKSITLNAQKPYLLTKINSFGLKNCTKFGIINCDKSYLSEFNFHFPSHVVQGSYYLNVFCPPNNETKYSLHKIKAINPKNIYINDLSKEEKQILLDAKNNFLNLFNKYKEYINVPDEINKEFSSDLVLPYKKYNFPQLENLRYLLARNVKINFSKEDYNICLGYIFYKFTRKIAFKKKAILYAKLIIDFLNDLQLNLKGYNLNVLRMLFWYKKCYISNSDLEKKIEKINEINESINDFKLCYPKNCSENTPYNNAIVFLENFIENLNENSYLLEILYLIDSEASSNRIYKSCRFFHFSLLSLEQIKSHLKLSIPEVIIRYKNSEKSETNGSYIYKYGVTRIYENEIYKLENNFDKYLIEEKDTDYRYSIPLIMFLFHECFCHAKIKKTTEGSESPNYFYNPHEDYGITFHDYHGESGRVFEFYISPNIDKIRFLKYSLSPLQELKNVNLWVKENLEELNKIIDKQMKLFDMDTIKDQEIHAFPTGEIEKVIEFAENNLDYDSEVFSSLYEEDKKNITKNKKSEKNFH